ncbi:MAG: acyl carrier protein [Firmicutes bacterium]|nr:acyl carrier protein [Bacillota bacterium]
MTETEEKIRDIFVEQLNMDESLWHPELTFEELAVDSLDIIEITVSLEDAFAIELDEQKLMACETVGRFVAVVLDCIGAEL